MMFIRSIPKLTRTLLVTILVVITLGLIASFSRGGWVSTICAMACIVAFHKSVLYFGYLAIFVLICVLIVSIKVPNLWEVVFERFGTIFNAAEDASSVGRIALIKSSIWMWMDYPIFGVVSGDFRFYSPNISIHRCRMCSPSFARRIRFRLKSLRNSVSSALLYPPGCFFTILFHGYRSFRTMKSDILRCNRNRSGFAFPRIHYQFHLRDRHHQQCVLDGYRAYLCASACRPRHGGYHSGTFCGLKTHPRTHRSGNVDDILLPPLGFFPIS